MRSRPHGLKLFLMRSWITSSAIHHFPATASCHLNRRAICMRSLATTPVMPKESACSTTSALGLKKQLTLWLNIHTSRLPLLLPTPYAKALLWLICGVVCCNRGLRLSLPIAPFAGTMRLWTRLLYIASSLVCRLKAPQHQQVITKQLKLSSCLRKMAKSPKLPTLTPISLQVMTSSLSAAINHYVVFQQERSDQS